MNYDDVYSFIVELDQLKSVYRNSFLSDQSRNENSAEHSWHLAMSILLFESEIKEEINFFRTIKMALIHDICEIGAGDISVYDKDRDKKHHEEKEYVHNLNKRHDFPITNEIVELWEEYEKQETQESKWVKVFDRLLPFCMNLITKGKSWEKQNVKKHQVIKVNEPIKEQSPEMYAWVLEKIDYAVELGWLQE